jgi:hypothetical protein
VAVLYGKGFLKWIIYIFLYSVYFSYFIFMIYYVFQ